MTNDLFDFERHSTLQVGKDLVSVSWDDLVITRFSNISQAGQVEAEVIATLDQKRDACSATLYDDRLIYIIGGFDSYSAKKSALCWDLTS